MAVDEMKPPSPLMKFKQFLRGRRSMPDLRRQIVPNLDNTTIQGTVKHDWDSHRPKRTQITEETTIHTPERPHSQNIQRRASQLTLQPSGLGSNDSNDNESINSAFSFNVSVQYYKEKDDTTVATTAHQFDSDERVMELLEGNDEDNIDWNSSDDIMDVEVEDETDNLFNRDLFGLGVMKRAQSNLELN